MKDIHELMASGRCFAAYDLLCQSLAADEQVTAELEVQRGRVLERLGDVDGAEAILRERVAAGHRSEEALGLLGGLLKRRGFEAEADVRHAFHDEAERLYREGLEAHASYWCGVNVALLEHLRGDHDAAQATSQRVLARVDAAAPTTHDALARRYLLGTRAECLLLAGRTSEAAEAFRPFRAACEEAGAWEQLASMRANVRRIRVSEDAEGLATIEQLLRVPPVWIAAGHRLDEPDRPRPRFPSGIVDGVRQTIEALVEQVGCSAGYSSLAAGTDAIFQHVLAERGLRREVVLPYDRALFRNLNVLGQDPATWASTFDTLLDTADRVHQTARHAFGWDALCYSLANEVVLGLAQLEARRLDTELVGFALFDGRPPDGPGGTADTLELWDTAGIEVHVVDPQGLTGAGAARHAVTPRGQDVPSSRERGVPNLIAAFLCADAKGFSRLEERQTAVFVQQVLGIVADVQAGFEADILERNTWGDALFYAFRDVASCGAFALDMMEALEARRAELQAAGLPADLGFRVALHAGPVRLVTDPVTGVRRVVGTQITFAARMEPVARVGQIVASDTFAALSEARGCPGHECVYLGVHSLAKGFGEDALYGIARRKGVGFRDRAAG
ncbi:MAG: tetratricopeptide repeat-containing protein [Planctomycetota bacterium]